MPPRRPEFPPSAPLRLALPILGLVALVLALLAPAASAQIPFGGGGGAAEAPEAGPAAEEEPVGVGEALRLLAIVIEDPEARSALVEQLRAVEPADPAAPPADPADPLFDITVPQILADETLTFAEDVGAQVVGLVSELLAVGEVFELARDYEYRAAWEGVQPVLLVVVAVVLVAWLMRVATRPVLRRFEGSAGATKSAVAPFRWKLLGLLVEAVRVLIAWAIGIGLAFMLGGGEVTLEQGIFLTAFLWVEGTRTAIRAIFRPLHPGLRMIRMLDTTARHWTFWTSRIVGVLGYGTLFLAPLAEALGAVRLPGWLTLASVIVAMVMTIMLVVRNRDRVRAGLEARVADARTDVIVAWLYPLAHHWHLITIGYLIALFVVWRAVPGNAVGFMVQATVSSIIVILLGSLLMALVTRGIADGVTVTERVRTRFPLLEARLNRLVPAALQVLRVVIAIITVAAILTFWGIFDAPGWLGTPPGQRILRSFLWIAAVLVVAGGVWLLVSSWIEYRLNPDVGEAPTPRERTLLALFSNAFVIVLAVITAMTVLTEVGINIAPLLAGAGVVGLAIGFGAQKLVQDIINGAFIQFENTMNEGDVVTAGGVTGVVEKLTIRSVSLRDLNGHYHMIPFSGVDTVTNFMKGFSFHVAEIDVAYRESIADVKAALQEAFDRLMETPHRANILPPLEIQGIVAFADSGITVRARIKTLPGQQWATGRAYSELIKEVFDERDIEIPFPHRTLYMGVDKAGEAPPLNLRSVRRSRPAERRERSGAGAAGEGLSNEPPPDLAGPDAGPTPPGEDEV